MALTDYQRHALKQIEEILTSRRELGSPNAHDKGDYYLPITEGLHNIQPRVIDYIGLIGTPTRRVSLAKPHLPSLPSMSSLAMAGYANTVSGKSEVNMSLFTKCWSEALDELLLRPFSRTHMIAKMPRENSASVILDSCSGIYPEPHPQFSFRDEISDFDQSHGNRFWFNYYKSQKTPLAEAIGCTEPFAEIPNLVATTTNHFEWPYSGIHLNNDAAKHESVSVSWASLFGGDK